MTEDKAQPMETPAFSFLVSEAVGEYGHHFPLLTSGEYPYMNVQIVPTPAEARLAILDELRRRHEIVAFAAGRTDFCAIQAGGGTPEHPTIPVDASNSRDVVLALRQCLQAAADFWASHSALDTKPDGPMGQ